MKPKYIFILIAILLVIGIGIYLLPKSEDAPPIQIVTPPPIESTQSAQITSDLKIEDIKEGTGSAVKSGDTVVMNYEGRLANGTKFDSSYDRGYPFETQIGVR